jgi:hypothetical protein
MRAVVVASLVAFLYPAAVMAQNAPAPAGPAPAAPGAAAPGKAAPSGEKGITRDEYVDRAKRNAERRFDEMDANHDGVLNVEERRAWRESHHRGGKPASAPAAAPASK